MTGVAPVQRGVLHRRAHSGGEPGRAEARRVGAGEGHARQRTRVAVRRRCAVGTWADRRPTSSSYAQTLGVTDATLRQRLASVYTESEILRLIRLRTVSAAIKGRPPGPEASVRKALADEHGQHIMELAKDLSGAHGMLATERQWHYGYLFAPALTVGGGTSRCSATSSASVCSASRTTSTSKSARPGARPSNPDWRVRPGPETPVRSGAVSEEVAVPAAGGGEDRRGVRPRRASGRTSCGSSWWSRRRGGRRGCLCGGTGRCATANRPARLSTARPCARPRPRYVDARHRRPENRVGRELARLERLADAFAGHRIGGARGVADEQHTSIERVERGLLHARRDRPRLGRRLFDRRAEHARRRAGAPALRGSGGRGRASARRAWRRMPMPTFTVSSASGNDHA